MENASRFERIERPLVMEASIVTAETAGDQPVAATADEADAR
jgi:hypothetical protein